MYFNIYTVMMALFSFSLMALVFHLILQVAGWRLKINPWVLMMAIGLLGIRMLFPVDFHTSIGLYSEKFYTQLVLFMTRPGLVFGQEIIPGYFFVLIWILGSCFFLIRNLWEFLEVRKMIKDAKLDVSQAELALLNQVKQDMGLKDPVILLRSSMLGSPVMTKLGPTYIILPHKVYSKVELTMIFAHELFHLKHQDFILKNMLLLFRIIFWWNPILTMTFDDIEQVLELRCDRETSHFCNNRLAYMETLLKTARMTHDYEKALAPLSGFGKWKKSDLNQRFVFLSQTKSKRSHNGLVLLAMLGLFAFSYIFYLSPHVPPPLEEGMWIGEELNMSYDEMQELIKEYENDKEME